MKKLITILTASVLLVLSMAGCQLEREERSDAVKTAGVIAYISEDLAEAEARSLSAQIVRINGVLEAKFVTAEEALKDFMEEHENEEAFSGIDASHLRHRYEITVEKSELDEVVQQLEKIKGFAEVKAAKDISEPFA